MHIFLETMAQIMSFSKEKPASGLRNLIHYNSYDVEVCLRGEGLKGFITSQLSRLQRSQ